MDVFEPEERSQSTSKAHTAALQGKNCAPPAPPGAVGECAHIRGIVRGSTIGVLSIQSYTVHKFGESHLRLVSQIANQLSVALDNTQLFQQVQTYAADLEERVNERTEQVAREHRRIQTLLSITTELSASLDLDMVLDRTLVVINETIGYEHSTILLSQIDSSLLYLRAVQGYVLEIPKVGKQSALKRTEGLAGWILNNRQAVLIDDLWADGRSRKRNATLLSQCGLSAPQATRCTSTGNPASREH